MDGRGLLAVEMLVSVIVALAADDASEVSPTNTVQALVLRYDQFKRLEAGKKFAVT